MTEIKITGGTPLEALAEVTAFGIHCTGNAEVYGAAKRILETTLHKTTDAPPPAATPVPVPAPTAPSPAIVPTAPTAAAPSFTHDQVGKAGADLIAANPGKMQELLDLLQQFGVPAVTALAPEQLGPFATALRGLGATI